MGDTGSRSECFTQEQTQYLQGVFAPRLYRLRPVQCDENKGDWFHHVAAGISQIQQPAGPGGAGTNSMTLAPFRALNDLRQRSG